MGRSHDERTPRPLAARTNPDLDHPPTHPSPPPMGSGTPAPARTRRPRGRRMREALDAEDWPAILMLVSTCRSPFDTTTSSKSAWSCNPLQLAAVRDHVQAVEALLAAGAAVNARNVRGQTALALAVAADAAAAASVLIRAGAALDAPDNAGWTPLCTAVGFGHAALARKLLHAGARANGGPRAVPLVLAARAGDARLVAQLLSAGADPAAVAAPAREGAAAASARVGAPRVLRALLEAGAPPDAPNAAGARPLFFAAEAGHVRVMRELLAAGADPSAKLPDGSDAMYAAAQGGNVAAIRMLIAAGARTDCVNKAGAGPVCPQPLALGLVSSGLSGFHCFPFVLLTLCQLFAPWSPDLDLVSFILCSSSSPANAGMWA